MIDPSYVDPMTSRIPTTDALHGLAEAIVTDGFAAHHIALADVIAMARRAGVRPVLVDIVADDGSPVVARQRALGRLLLALGAGHRDRVPPAAAVGRTLAPTAA